jgi:hypothetical protein
MAHPMQRYGEPTSPEPPKPPTEIGLYQLKRSRRSLGSAWEYEWVKLDEPVYRNATRDEMITDAAVYGLICVEIGEGKT